MAEIRTRRYAAALAVVTVLTGLNAYALTTFDVVGVPFVFGTALLVQLLLIISFAFSLVMALHTPLKIIFSILASAGQGIQANPYIVSLRGRYPRLTRWAGQRFSRQHPYGLVLTAGVAAAAASLLLFLNITQAVVLRTSFAGLDQRILNLVPHIRTFTQNALFSVLTFAASSASFAVFVIVLTLASWRARKLWLPVLFAGAFLLRTIGSTAAKHRRGPAGAAG
ncbi:hypothetical protein [Pseudarthrobacter sp. H2]|uniref:hypothetical protein n=1 Tax=Pseudarthrobacter sp. H2 TaxID=3418415 RepID=UPI003CEFA2AC